MPTSSTTASRKTSLSTPITTTPKPPANLKNITSRVGSLDNLHHTPQGGTKKIFSEVKKFDGVKSRVGSLDNINHTPHGGQKPIPRSTLPHTHKQISSRVGSLDNIAHVPAKSNVRIHTAKTPDFKGSVVAKVPSHVAGAGSLGVGLGHVAGGRRKSSVGAGIAAE
ncbi:uncharacterized protein EV422DRAFT_614628 [Fimicolochytrium jonesii]|uniref:uncharacterized protein n=1 Tax=Fimicolochytrium jonesii TaxID=1396493 RepID=UPI0022FDBEDE|nr:uncharacterized protein EV422DRAFT_614628 [Fimicolochytrium jonesii]KAI8822189.1 hypothetical protein EV422DRAFT_614628 [Fimicolochytrium jonesii]